MGQTFKVTTTSRNYGDSPNAKRAARTTAGQLAPHDGCMLRALRRRGLIGAYDGTQG